jgi:hypothetical protein
MIHLFFFVGIYKTIGFPLKAYGCISPSGLFKNENDPTDIELNAFDSIILSLF